MQPVRQELALVPVAISVLHKRAALNKVIHEAPSHFSSSRIFECALPILLVVCKLASVYVPVGLLQNAKPFDYV